MKKTKICSLLAISCLLSLELVANSTAVQLANINPTTGGSISAPGRYYLGWDLPTGTLSIAADNVILDLNGHTIRRMSISNHTNVTITNGILDGSNLSTGSVLDIQSCTNMRISDIAVLNAGAAAGYANGIGIGSSRNVLFSNCLIEGNSSAGCRMGTNCNQIFFNDCTFRKNGISPSMDDPAGRVGLFIDGSIQDVECRRCLFLENQLHGVSMRGGATQLYFFDCESNNNGTNATGSGFQGGDPSDVDNTSYTLVNCQAIGNKQYGFSSGSKDIFYLLRCLAESNGAGGFISLSTMTGIVRECVAVNNPCGFDNTIAAGGMVRYVGNYAYNFTGLAFNYCLMGMSVGAGVAPYYTLSYNDNIAQFWRNIDGTIILP